MASQLSSLEIERNARIAANKLRLQQIGLLQTVQQIAGSQGHAKKAARAAKTASRAARKAVGAGPSAGRVRRSERVMGIDAPNYNENAKVLSLADKEGGSRDRRLLRAENVSEEIYDVEHLDALGDHQTEWTLFEDGYDAAGNRVYDKVNGLTCHQCRQKTLGKRTCCAGCESLQGVLCGDCLFMRYGENVEEVNANPDWLCPLCRDICNCSFHRSKRGWAPTGTLYRHATAEGYKSVAHYLVLNNLSDEAKPVALQRGMCPPELAEELKKEIAEGPKPTGQEEEEEAQEEAAVEEPVAAGRRGQVAVQGQLLELGASPAPEAAAPAAGRSALGGSAALVAPQAAPAGQKGKRQATIQLATTAASKKQSKGSSAAGAAAAVKGGAAAVAAPQRRGLRSAGRS